MPKIVHIGVGSNLNDPKKNCEQAIALLGAHPEITLVSQSSFYETEPWGIKEQNWFVNAVVKAETTLPPENLLRKLFDIEKQMGRTRGEKWGPRVIDLDLLLYEDLILDVKDLRIPHPEMQNRGFVLTPLLEIDPKHIHPVLKKTPGELLELLPERQTTRKI